MSLRKYKGICLKSYPNEDDIDRYVIGEITVDEIEIYEKGKVYDIMEGFNEEVWKIATIEDFPGAYIFGNKGAVWSNKAHLTGIGPERSKTLCGTPMLSSNHVRIQGITEVGCQVCIDKYFELKDKETCQE
jgi:hypothetical protein